MQAYAQDAERLSAKSEIEDSAEIFVLLPLFQETAVASQTITRFAAEFGGTAVRVYVCIHQSDTETLRIAEATIALCAPSNVNLIINRSHSHSKASQLTAAIEFMRPILRSSSIISIFDSDSIPDRRIVGAMSRWTNQTNTEHPIGAMQQAPFYPLLPTSSVFSSIAQARAIHSLVYHYCSEQPTYRASCNGSYFAMAIHLVGHGEHIPFNVLEACGGFREPSCDSSLGFSLSYRGYGILPLPIPDVSQTPLRIRDVWQQGIRWYRGCDLYWRELWHVGATPSRLVKATGAAVNNLRWFAFWPLSCVAIASSLFGADLLALLLAGACLSACYLRHIVMYACYRQISTLSRWQSDSPRLWSWSTTTFLYYLAIRLIWSLVPLQFYLLKLFGKKVLSTSTPKAAHGS